MRSRSPLYRAVGLLGALFAPCTPSLFGQQALQGWDIKAQTTAIVLDAVDESQGTVATFTFRNASQRTVAAFAVSFDSDHHFYADFFETQKGGLAPGEVHKAGVGFGGPRSLEISAVLFEDSTGEGSKRYIDRMRYNQIGQMIETERLNRLLQGVTEGSVADTNIDSLVRQVGELPAGIEGLRKTFGTADMLGFSVVEQARRQPETYELRGLVTGVHGERSQALRALAELSADQNTTARNASLLHLRASYQAASARHSALRTRIQQGAGQ